MQSSPYCNESRTCSGIKSNMVNRMGIGMTDRPLNSSPAPKLAMLNPTKMGTRANDLEKRLRQLICGHEETILEIVKIYESHLAGLSPVDRPLGAFLFAGPSGSGKIRTVEAIANALLGSPNAIIRIDCAEFQHSYDITKLIGSPQGYPEYKQNRPILSQEVFNKDYSDAVKLSILVFEEIEKGSQALWKRLFTMVATGVLVLGDNRKVDLSRTLIFLTSTVGEAHRGACAKSRFGHLNSALDDLDRIAVVNCGRSRSKVNTTHRKITPEFLNHLDRIEVFGTFGGKDLDQLIDSEIQIVQQRLQSSTAKGRFFIDVTESARHFLLAESAYCRSGAFLLKRAIDQSLLRPLSTLIVTKQVHACDRIRVTHIGASPTLTFFREEDEWEERRLDEAVG